MLKDITILVGDNSSNIGIPMTNYLQTLGYKVAFCNKDGAEILQYARRLAPEVIIMDLYLPHIASVTLMEQIRAVNPFSPVFIISTSVDNSDMIAEIKKHGVEYVLLQPFDFLILKSVLSNVAKKYLKISDDYSLTPAPLRKVNIEIMVTEHLNAINMKANLTGYHYIRKGIVASIENPKHLVSFTKELYPRIASYFGSTTGRVERSMRHAIEKTWNECDHETFSKHFGGAFLHKKPTTSEFISLFVDNIILKIKFGTDIDNDDFPFLKR